MLKIAFIPFLITLSILYFAFFSIASTGLDSLQETSLKIKTHETYIENGVTNTTTTTQTYTGNWLFDFLLKYSITSWIVNFLVYTVGSFFILWISLFISIIIIGFLTPNILNILQKKHYPNLIFNGYGNLTNSIFKLLKSLLVMIILFFILIPFYFIPVINIVAINLPFYYFFHKMLHYDVASTIMKKERFDKIYYFNKSSMRLKTLFLYSVSLIPFVAFFIAVFYIIYLGHTYFVELLKQNNEA